MPTCASCGFVASDVFKFCPECGAPAPATLTREQRKTVTVLFCDITGSTELGETTDPEPLRALLARYFERMRAIVEAHGGTVEKFIGDAVMAVFGVPVLHEDDALRAVRAAAEMRDALPQLGVRARIGVHTGEVVTGTAERLATGDAVNVAARLEQAAAPGEVLLGATTMELVRGSAEVEELPPLEVKGKAKPVAAFRLLTVAAQARERQHARAPIVGRQTELRRLSDAFAQAVQNRSCQLFTVLGTAGVGKSRLAAEFLSGIEARLARGRCLSYGEGITYWPVVEVVKQLDTLPADRAAADVLASLLGEAEAEASAEEIAWAFRKLLEEQAQERPLVCVFDDLHWGEETFIELVEHVADLSRDAPILLLCLARPELLERRPAWGGGKWNATTVLLEPLDAAETRRLLDSLGAELDESLRSRILVAAEGNPLFVEEVLALVSASGGGEVTVPPTIQALLAARLDQLDPAERGVLERGAVEGRVFHQSAVQALSDGDAQLTARLQALVRKELVRPERGQVPGDDAYRFRHLLIRDAAYASLPKTVRAELHQRFAAWLEQRGTDLVEFDEIIGHHLEQAARYRTELGQADAELAGNAGGYLAAAGQRALDRGDVPAAINLLTRATSLLGPDEPARAGLLVDLGQALVDSGELDRAAAIFHDAINCAVRVHDGAAAARARVGRLVILGTAGEESERLLVRVGDEIAILDRLGDDVGLAEAWEIAATLQTFRGRTGTAADAYDRAAAHASASGYRRLQRRVQASRIVQEAWGHFPADEGIRNCDRLLVEAEGTALEPYIRAARALYRCWQGDFAGARSDTLRARSLLRDFGNDLMAESTGMIEAQVELAAGDPVAAEAAARDAYDALGHFDEQGYRSTVGCLLAEALCQLRRDAEAEQVAVEAAALASADDFVTQARSRTVRAAILARRGDRAQAELLAREALDIAAPTDSFGEHAQALVSLANLLVMDGRESEAAVFLAEAAELYERKAASVAVAAVREQLAALPS